MASSENRLTAASIESVLERSIVLPDEEKGWRVQVLSITANVSKRRYSESSPWVPSLAGVRVRCSDLAMVRGPLRLDNKARALQLLHKHLGMTILP